MATSHRPSSRVIPTHMESAVTKLLVATRQLLESLQMWSAMKMTDLEVSDTYVKLGNDFNNAVGAFVQNGVSMDDLLSVPQDLRECLESLLALDPTPENLDIYLPRVRQIIVTLLSGLKAKQAMYRKLTPRDVGEAGDPRQVLLARAEGRTEAFGNPFSNGESSKSSRMGFSHEASAARRSASRSPEPTQGTRGSRHVPTRPDLPPASQMISSASTSTLPSVAGSSDRHLSSSAASMNGSLPSRVRSGPLPPAPPDAFRPPRRRVTPNNEQSPRTPVESSFPQDPPPQGRALPSVPVPAGTPPSIPTRSAERERFALKDAPSPSPHGSPVKPPREDESGDPVTPPRRRSHVSKRSSGGSVQEGKGEETVDQGFLLGSRFSLDSETETPKTRRRMTALTGLETAAGEGFLPPLARLASLEEGLSVDTTSKAHPLDSGEASAPATGPATATKESPAALASLTALQNSEALGRRASKRFSQYQYKQLLPGHHKGPSSSSMRHSRMGSLVEDAAQGEASIPAPGPSPVRPARRVVSRSQPEIPPVPPIPEQMLRRDVEEPEQPPIPTIVVPDEATVSADREPGPDEPEPVEAEPATILYVFLQYGRETKKITLDRREVTTIADLQGLFMNKFEYAPEGREMFPDMYIKDVVSGIAYHLEDMDDVKPGVLLSLNIDQLDQVKQHFDNTISGLLHEIKELKHNVAQNRRLSAYKPEHGTLSPSMHPVDRSVRSPGRFQASRPSSPVSGAIALPDEPMIAAPTTAAPPNLHAQLDDVQSLRRELGVMRQQYVDFVNQSKTAFQSIRDQTQSMREISTTKLSGSRALLNSGKSALETESVEVVRAVEEVSDAIDAVKDDVVRRQILPPPHRMETMRRNLEQAQAYVEKLKSQVSLVAPAWKATWNEELSTVLEEQRLLKYHESLAGDLEGDVEQARGIFGTLTEYMAQRSQGMGTRRGFRAPQPKTVEPAATVPNLLLEIRTQETDPNRRLRAIEEQQRARERERRERAHGGEGDEFAAELEGFVVGRKLKRTGGTEEAERVRVRKQEISLKKMFVGQEGEAMTPGKALEAVEEPGEAERE